MGLELGLGKIKVWAGVGVRFGIRVEEGWGWFREGWGFEELEFRLEIGL